MENTSPKFKLDLVDLYKVARGFLVVILGSAVTYASQVYLNFDYTIVIKDTAINLSFIAIPAISSLIETARRWLTTYQAASKVVYVEG